MITEDYVSFDTAKLLNEKGFDEPCGKVVLLTKINTKARCDTNLFIPGRYSADSTMVKEQLKEETRVHGVESEQEAYPCPTVGLAMKWLREVHGIQITTGYTYSSETEVSYCWGCECYAKHMEYVQDEWYYTYEKACDEAIKYCLETLV